MQTRRPQDIGSVCFQGYLGGILDLVDCQGSTAFSPTRNKKKTPSQYLLPPVVIELDGMTSISEIMAQMTGSPDAPPEDSRGVENGTRRKLEAGLALINAKGNFTTPAAVEADPELLVRGVGLVALPSSASQAKELVSQSRQAPLRGDRRGGGWHFYRGRCLRDQPGTDPNPVLTMEGSSSMAW